MPLRQLYDWEPTIGKRVEVRLNGHFVDAGISITVVRDGNEIWLLTVNSASAVRYQREDGFQVWSRKNVVTSIISALGAIGEPKFE